MGDSAKNIQPGDIPALLESLPPEALADIVATIIRYANSPKPATGAKRPRIASPPLSSSSEEEPLSDKEDTPSEHNESMITDDPDPDTVQTSFAQNMAANVINISNTKPLAAPAVPLHTPLTTVSNTGNVPQNGTPPPPTPAAPPATQDPPAARNQSLRVPPIIISDSSKFGYVREVITKFKLKQKCSAVYRHDGIHFSMATVEDYKLLLNVLKANKVAFHHFTLPEDKVLKVVLRGIPEFEPPEFAKEGLEAKGYKVLKAVRMRRMRTKTPLPLILAELPREQKDVFQETDIFGLRIRVESLRQKAAQQQCHRCQSWGHTQSNCYAPANCVKCGKKHLTAECKKPITAEPVCVHCRGPHPASYRGCPKWPKPAATKTAHPLRQYATVTAGRSYANAASPPPAAPPAAPPAPTPAPRNQRTQNTGSATIPKGVNEALSVMLSAFMASNPTTESWQQFINAQQLLLNSFKHG